MNPMLFCPKCGSIMLPTKKEGKKLNVCRCGHSSKEAAPTLKEIIKKAPSTVGVAKNETNTLPKTEADCPKCHSKTAFYWTMQTRAADEGETKFLKCEICNHTWRDYG